MNSCVLDASVAAKWFLPEAYEPHVPEAKGVLTAYEMAELKILVPDLFWVEMGSIFRKTARRGAITAELAKMMLAQVTAFGFPTVTTRALLKRALEIANQHDRTIHDCFYVALAEESGHPLVTADEKLVNALRSRFPIRWLGALS